MCFPWMFLVHVTSENIWPYQASCAFGKTSSGAPWYCNRWITRKKCICGHLFIMAFRILRLHWQVPLQKANEIKIPPAGPWAEITPKGKISRLFQKQILLHVLHKFAPSERLSSLSCHQHLITFYVSIIFLDEIFRIIL